MVQGISTNRRLTSKAQCLRDAGLSFVCRYYSRTTHQPEKVLTQSEATALIAAGMQIVAVYEDGPTNPGYFSRQRGYDDAVAAAGFGHDIGQTAGSAIYFAVDYDATPSTTTGAITEYFEGVQQGLATAGGAYLPGVYGSGRVCSHIKDTRGLAKYSWLAESTGWAGSSTYSTWDLRQAVSNGALCGLPGGLNGGYEDNVGRQVFGAFPGMTPPSSGLGAAGLSMPGSTPPPPTSSGAGPSAYVSSLVALALDQYQRFHQYTESDAVLRDQIRRYWEEIGFDFPGVGTAWSAVFVSWLVKTAGAPAAEFKPSTAHSRFVHAAIQNQLANRGVFRGRRIDEYQPAPGDIVHANRNGSKLTYDFAASHEAYESHSAVVVAVGQDQQGRFVHTVGGNESDSVGLKRVGLTNEGFVAQRPTNPYICVIQNLK